MRFLGIGPNEESLRSRCANVIKRLPNENDIDIDREVAKAILDIRLRIEGLASLDLVQQGLVTAEEMRNYERLCELAWKENLPILERLRDEKLPRFSPGLVRSMRVRALELLNLNQPIIDQNLEKILAKSRRHQQEREEKAEEIRKENSRVAGIIRKLPSFQDSGGEIVLTAEIRKALRKISWVYLAFPRLDNLIEQGLITEEQSKNYLEIERVAQNEHIAQLRIEGADLLMKGEGIAIALFGSMLSALRRKGIETTSAFEGGYYVTVLVTKDSGHRLHIVGDVYERDNSGGYPRSLVVKENTLTPEEIKEWMEEVYPFE